MGLGWAGRVEMKDLHLNLILRGFFYRNYEIRNRRGRF